MSTLHQIFKNELIWQEGINPKLQNITEDTFRYSHWYRCPSRTLNNVLNHTISSCYTSSKAFRTLYALCALLNNNIQLQFYPEYRVITSDMSGALEENLYTQLAFPRLNTSYFNIVLYHIPKGKSFIRPVLDNLTDINRLKQIETFCILGPQHFLRIYRNFNSSGLNTITVISDTYTTDLIYRLWAMLPHLMGITLRTATETQELTTEDITHNTRVNILFEIFNIFYEILKSNTDIEYTSKQLRTIQTNLLRLTTQYAEQFDFVTGALETFTKRLAKAKNNIASTYLTQTLEHTTELIKNYEKNLSQEYTKKLHLERQINAIRISSEEDTKPFIETILNSKHIEVLNSNENEIKIRVTAPLQYFQESDFEVYEKNETSMYNIHFKKNPILQQIFHKVFITREYKLLLQAVIKITIQNDYHNTPLKYTTERTGQNLTQFPNPHLYHYDCWGAAKNEMNKNICEGNYELVVMQMIAAVQSINVAETASFINSFLMDVKDQTRLREKLTFIVETPTEPLQLKYHDMIEYERNLEKQKLLEQSQTTLTNTKEYTQIEIPDDDANWTEENNVSSPNF